MKHFLARLGAGILIALAAIAVMAAPAHAVDAYLATGFAIAFTLDPLMIVQGLIAFVLPVLVGLVTTKETKPGRKAWYLAALSLVNSVLVELARALTDAVTFDLGVALLAAMPGFVISVAAHYGLWKPTGVAAAAQRVGTSSDGGEG